MLITWRTKSIFKLAGKPLDWIPLGVYTGEVKLADSSDRKALYNRLCRIEGQLRGIRAMIDDGEDCAKVAMQLSAVRSAVNQTLGAFALCAIEQSRESGGKHDAEISKVIKTVL